MPAAWTRWLNFPGGGTLPATPAEPLRAEQLTNAYYDTVRRDRDRPQPSSAAAAGDGATGQPEVGRQGLTAQCPPPRYGARLLS